MKAWSGQFTGTQRTLLDAQRAARGAVFPVRCSCPRANVLSFYTIGVGKAAGDLFFRRRQIFLNYLFDSADFWNILWGREFPLEESPVISFQTCVGSAFSSSPIRWIETPEAARSRYAIDQLAEQSVAKVADPDLGKPRSESGDILDLSQGTQKVQAASQSDSRITLENSKENSKFGAEKSEFAPQSTEKLPSGTELTQEEQQEVEKLKTQDQEVRIHEMAHVIAGGAYVTSGPSYTYKTGPDGKGYVVSGSVGIDTSPVQGDPEATIQKMQTVAAAALAPAQPSGQDLKVAAQARQAEAKARAELSQLQAEQQETEKQPEGENASAFSLVRPADRMADAVPKSHVSDSVMPSLVKAGAEHSPSSAYKAQSTMTLASSRFSVFA